MAQKINKLRVTLSEDAVEAILEANNYLPDAVQNEVTRVMELALYKLRGGLTKPAYTVQELTLEQKVNRGIASTEELEQYERELMESI